MDHLLFGICIGIPIGAVFGVICTVLFLSLKFPAKLTKIQRDADEQTTRP